MDVTNDFIPGTSNSENEINEPISTDNKDDSVASRTTAEATSVTYGNRPKRTTKFPSRYTDYVSSIYNDLEEKEKQEYSMHTKVNDVMEKEPATLAEAKIRSDGELWEKAAKDEMNSLIQNNTWELTNLPEGRKAVGCRWVFKVKKNADGKVTQYKARLVAKGYLQQKGIDFDETFAPVSKLVSVRTILVYAMMNRMEVHQMDVMAAYLNGKLDEEIFMLQPEGFITKGMEGKVLKLKKALYGLKQAGRQWHQCFSEVICRKLGFIRSHCDHGIFTRKSKTNTIISIYVDDVLIISNDSEEIEEIKKTLNDELIMKDLGMVNSFLNISVKLSIIEGSLTLSQRGYAEDIIRRFNMNQCRPCTTPMEPSGNTVLTEEEELADKMEYLQMIGCLMYLAQATRPELSYSISYLSRFSQKPKKSLLRH